MRKFEYRIEKIEFREKKKSREERMLEVLNDLGQHGWEVCSLDVEPRDEDDKSITVLMMRKL
jgi:hypothetical protein